MMKDHREHTNIMTLFRDYYLSKMRTKNWVPCEGFKTDQPYASPFKNQFIRTENQLIFDIH